ncbi:MAG: FKBP-type peptidyl-prolyl cis-trans isomerase [Bacteroidota bacterium]|nr:FKBP-type peptidyl-prolyl cis-trans isomerase [Bacteroidota bacterium]
MKKNIFCIILLSLAFVNANAQNKTKQKSKKDPVAKAVFKSANDSASYAIGLSVAKFYQQQGVKKLNTILLTKAINDAFANKTLLLDDSQANNVIMNYLNTLSQAKALPTIAVGEKFLATNKKKPGVKTTASGLQYEIITQGNGPLPALTDTVLCHYKGSLLNGTEFENSYTRGEPITFSVGGVIKGWTEALLLMPVGSKWKLYIPYQLGYGTSDYGSIPGGSVLVFDIELLGIVNKTK